MFKLIIAGLVIAGAVVAGVYLYNANNATYAAAVDSDVTELETELAELEAAAAAGTLTQEEADAAYVRITARLDAIQSNVATAQSARLTTTQRQVLMAALDRLKVTLENYRETLVTVEANASTETKKRRSGGSYRSLTEIVTETIEVLEEYLEEEEEMNDEEIADTEDEDTEMNDDENTDEMEDEEDNASDTSTTTESEMDEGTSTVETEVEIEGEVENEPQQ